VSRNRPDFAAPHWLIQLLRGKQTPIPWTMVIRAPIALALPIAIAFAAGDLRIGALISTGALPTVMSEASGPYRYRLRRLGGATLAAVLGYALGLAVGGNPGWSIPVVIVVAAASTVISAASSNASVAGLQLFVFSVLGIGQHALGTRTDVSLICFIVGAAWSLTVALIGWTVRATSPERTAVAQVYIELAAMLSAKDESTSRAARYQLTTAMNAAYDRLLTARSWLSGRDATYRRLLNLLSASTSAVESAIAVVNARRRVPEETVDYLVSVAAAVLADQPLPKAPQSNPDFAPLYAGLARIHSGTERTRHERLRLGSWLRQWVDSLAGPITWLAALRLSLCVGLAELAGLLLPFERSYWITLTVGIVLKPDFGSVFGRAVLRGLGTVAGVGLGAAVLGIDVRGWPLVVLIGVFAAGLPIGKARNYGLMSALVTPLIILQMDLASAGNWSVVSARLIDTALGCAIVLVFGYLLWPGSMKPRVGGLLAEAVDTVASYLAAAFASRSSSPSQESSNEGEASGASEVSEPTVEELAEDKLRQARARRRAYRILADLRTTFQQVIVEPSPAGRQAVAWWPVIAGLERVTDSITEVVVSVEDGAPSPERVDVELIITALNELAAAVREQRQPCELSFPEGDQLRDVVDQISTVLGTLRGPELEDSSSNSLLRRFLPGYRSAT
jgi:uncharacterized membrane protein YccC